MSHFGWIAWNRLHVKHKSGVLPHGREREALKFLHRESSLFVLAKRIALASPGIAVHVESIWVDGTPQATFTDSAGNTANCELADLLLIVRKELPNGGLIAERALLLQAKITPKYNRLTSGSSTALERRLLERVARHLPLTLHRDTCRTSLINSYLLGTGVTGPIGLKDCARYLLAPKGAVWANAMYPSYSPYQVGWPSSRHSPFLRRPIGFVDAVMDVGVRETAGRVVTSPPGDAWSQIISDLRGGYTGVFMQNYAQHRIHSGTAFLSLSGVSGAFAWNHDVNGYHLINRRDLPPLNFEQVVNRPPLIPIVVVTLGGDEEVFYQLSRRKQ